MLAKSWGPAAQASKANLEAALAAEEAELHATTSALQALRDSQPALHSKVQGLEETLASNHHELQSFREAKQREWDAAVQQQQQLNEAVTKKQQEINELYRYAVQCKFLLHSSMTRSYNKLMSGVLVAWQYLSTAFFPPQSQHIGSTKLLSCQTMLQESARSREQRRGSCSSTC